MLWDTICFAKTLKDVYAKYHRMQKGGKSIHTWVAEQHHGAFSSGAHLPSI